jgi:hypothetical protein
LSLYELFICFDVYIISAILLLLNHNCIIHVILIFVIKTNSSFNIAADLQLLKK